MTDATRAVDLSWLEGHDDPLHPDLVPHFGERGGFPMIHHPLIVEIGPHARMVNARYEYKKARLAEAIAAQRWNTVVSLHERAYRTDALIDYVIGRDENDVPLSILTVSDPAMRDLVVEVWTDSENINEHVDDWLAITSGWTPGDPLMLANADESAEFDALPERLELWRGDCDDGGWSWSLRRHVGEFFAHRFAQDHALLHGFVDKRNVFGFITRRGESEVMVRREHVDVVETLHVG